MDEREPVFIWDCPDPSDVTWGFVKQTSTQRCGRTDAQSHGGTEGPGQTFHGRSSAAVFNYPTS